MLREAFVAVVFTDGFRPLVQPSVRKGAKVQPIDDNHYITALNERIKVYVCVDKPPYLCVFQDPPDGSQWENQAMHGNCEERYFRTPAQSGGKVTYDAIYDAQIADSDPDPKATYTITISGSAGGSRTSKVVVPKGAGPITITYYFTNI